jgi:hypothetical protein
MNYNNGKVVKLQDGERTQTQENENIIDHATDISDKPSSSTSLKGKMTLPFIGAMAGLAIAYYRKSGVFGYVGFFILGTVAGSLVNVVVQKGKGKSKTPTLKEEEELVVENIKTLKDVGVKAGTKIKEVVDKVI